jgi:hypothetical protein
MNNQVETKAQAKVELRETAGRGKDKREGKKLRIMETRIEPPKDPIVPVISVDSPK